MELAIPIIALGGLFIVSNQKNKKKKDNFVSMGKKGSYLPNVDNLPQNYPVVNVNELVDTVQEYKNPNQATDKYFDQTYFENKNNDGIRTGANIQNIYSLTGNYLESEEFKHNNMVPFYGSKMYGGDFQMNMAQTQLDNMVGAGSQTIKKTEQAPLFKPEDNVQWAYGSPDMSDFYQSRVNPGMTIKNTIPFEQIQVGPGLNKGYTNLGSDGYNAGMEARDVWIDKNVDELRIATNPKESFSLLGLEGPAETAVSNVGIIGKVEKFRPDTFFVNTQDRWLTTTGQAKGNRLVPVEMVKEQKGYTGLVDYKGPANSALKTASYTTPFTEPAKKEQLEAIDEYPSHSYGGNFGYNDNHLKSMYIEKNNRSTVCATDTYGAMFNRSVGAAILPFVDMLKPTRKEEFSCNLYLGTPGSNIQHYKPEETPLNATIKETTMYMPNMYIGAQSGGGYLTNEQNAIGTQRTSTGCMDYMGPVGGAGNNIGNTLYNANYAQTNNETKESSVVSRINHGNTQIFNQTMNVSINKNDKGDCYMGTPGYIFGSCPVVEQIGNLDMPREDGICMTDRINPDLLKAFRENPYTHSLTNSV